MKKKTILIVGIIVFVLLCIITYIFVKGRVRTESGVFESGESFIVGTDSIGYAPLAMEESLSKEDLVNDAEGSKVQKTGSISFLVENLDTSIESVSTVNTKYLAQVTNIYDYGRGNDRVVQLTIKVPVTEFEAYYTELRELDGEVTYANISTTDVTEEYIDITSRLTNLRSVESQLVGILGQATTITDILAVQRELNTVRGDIESYEQRKRYFDSQTDYSYITLTLSIDKTGLNIADEEWKPWGEFKSALNSLVSVLKGFVNLIIWMVVFSPLVLIPLGIALYIAKRKRQTAKVV